MESLKDYLESHDKATIEEIRNQMECKEWYNEANALVGTTMEEPMKNRCYFELAEKIRFAKLQRESLRDTGAYNRHVAKSLHEMKNALEILFQLGVEREEILPVLKQYLELTGSVNTEQGWSDYDALKVYPLFAEFDAGHPSSRYRSD